MEDSQGRGHGQGDQPEPEDQVDLLVDNVQWQQAQSVMILERGVNIEDQCALMLPGSRPPCRVC